jgi:ArsR family transcriptional regulator
VRRALWRCCGRSRNPARYRIVKLLATRQTCVCGDLVGELPLAQSTVSEHLKVLKNAGLVRGTIEGPNTCYCLEPEALEWLKREFGELRSSCC